MKDLNQPRIIGFAFLQNEVLLGKPAGNRDTGRIGWMARPISSMSLRRRNSRAISPPPTSQLPFGPECKSAVKPVGLQFCRINP
jgi:hypothetical protein